MKGLLGHLATWLSQLFRKKKPYRTIFLEDLPDHLESNAVYVLGEGEHLWSAAMLCPCGCGETLHISLHQEGRPRWALINHGDGTVSFRPSIWRKHGCKSHFFFEQGLVRWCKNNDN